MVFIVTQHDIDILLWDRTYYVNDDNNNKRVVFEAPIDMNNKTITGLKDNISDDSSAAKTVKLRDVHNSLVNNYYTKVATDRLFYNKTQIQTSYYDKNLLY